MIGMSIAKKFAVALVILSVFPVGTLGVMHLVNLHELGKTAIEGSSLQLDRKAREALELRAIELAGRVSEFLRTVETDVQALCMLPKEEEIFRRFSLTHRKTIWTRGGTNENPIEVYEELPLYREIAFIAPSGMERIRIVGDHPCPQEKFRDVSKPENTTYRSETYFTEVMKLPPETLYVTHVTGWFVPLEEQLRGASSVEKAVEGRKYEGVVRFAMRCGGDNQGVVVLSLDHRHLMEFTMHTLPTEERFVVFPSYESGNYAFMFDDEGWIITHPKFCDIRSLRADGSAFDPTDPSYNHENLLSCRVPFHLDSAGMINPNYPLIAAEVRKGRSGVTNTFNVGGIPRVMAYAPIFYRQRPYDLYGIFGGITIGVETTTFRAPIATTEKTIRNVVSRTKAQSLAVLALTVLASLALAFLLARTITRPILHLAKKAREIAHREDPQDIALRTGDEIEVLSASLASMAQDIRQYRLHLERSLSELAASKQSLERYSQELEKQVWILTNIHYLSQLLSTVYERDRVLQEVLKTAVEGLGYDRAILYLFEPSKRRLFCRKTYQFSPDHDRRARSSSFHVDRENCHLVQAFRSGKTIFIENIRTAEGATELDRRIAEEGGSESVVWAPIRSRERVIGVIGADRIGGRPPIGKTEVNALEILANDAARAIERSELYWGLVRERNFIASILHHIPIGIIVLSSRGKIRWFNPYAEELFGIQDARGRFYWDVFADLPAWNVILEASLGSSCSSPSMMEHRLNFPDGKDRVIEYSCSALPETEGKTMLLLFFRDVTERKQMEEHVRRADRLASLGVLAAGIAHEMRNPLTGISLMLDDLHDRLHEPLEDRELIRQALSEIERLENLISGLLDFAAPTRGLRLETVSIDSVLADTLFLVRKLAKNHRVHLSTVVEETVPSVRVDREKMKQVLLNLFLNAIQAMSEGGELCAKAKGVTAQESLISQPGLRLTITDTGKGIPAEDIPYIFDPFFSRHPSGSGLGLAIVHSIIVEHGGRIAVSSTVGKGTTFTIDLPLDAKEEGKQDGADESGSHPHR